MACPCNSGLPIKKCCGTKSKAYHKIMDIAISNSKIFEFALVYYNNNIPGDKKKCGFSSRVLEKLKNCPLACDIKILHQYLFDSGAPTIGSCNWSYGQYINTGNLSVTSTLNGLSAEDNIKNIIKSLGGCILPVKPEYAGKTWDIFAYWIDSNSQYTYSILIESKSQHWSGSMDSKIDSIILLLLKMIYKRKPLAHDNDAVAVKLINILGLSDVLNDLKARNVI